MIRVDLVAAISIFVVLFVGAFLFLWITQHQVRTRGRNKGQNLVQCPYCGNVFVDASQKEIVICLICKSYVEVRHEDSRREV